MIKIASFKIDDGNKMTDLLSKYPIAKGSSVFVSNGKIAIPYDDGSEPSKELRISRLKEIRNEARNKMNELVHINRTQEVKAKGIKDQIEENEKILENSKKELSTISKDVKKQLEKELNIISKEGKKVLEKDIYKTKQEIERLNNILDQVSNQIIMSKVEITDKMTDIAVYNEEIHILENSKKENEEKE